MVHVYVAVQAYANRVLKYQGQCEREDMDKMFPGVHYDCFDTYMGDRITTNQPHNLVTGTSGDFDQDVTEEVFTENSLPPAIGYWAVCITSAQEFLKWGKDRQSQMPYQDEAEARAQVEYLVANPNCEAPLNPDEDGDMIFLMTIFSNGQITMDCFS